jgi:hypothetical protein
MANCYKPADVALGCDSADLQALSGALLIDLKAFKPTKSLTKKFTFENIEVIDPDTGLYPVALSEYLPVKIEWAKNAVKPNYEVVSSEVKADTYTQLASGLIINNSESDLGKETTMALATRKWVLVYKASGVADADDAYQVLGAKNGLQFVVEPTSDDVGGRVTGSIRSLTGGGEANPNGYNFLLATGIEDTDTLFNNRFETVIIP